MDAFSRRDALKTLALAGAALLPPVRVLAATAQELESSGLSLLKEGNTAQALTALKEAARLDAANPWVFNLLGRAYHQAGQPRPAADNFRMALRIDPADGYARMMLDILSQHPLPPAPPQEKPGGRLRRQSQLEEQAREELDAFVKTGTAPGTRLVLIDPGHGGADKGVAGATGQAEKDITLDVARLLAQALETGGKVRAMLTREADYAVPLWARKAQAGLFGAALFVSLHCGAALPGNGGIEVCSYARAASDPQAQALAELENGVLRFERSQPPTALVLPPAVALATSWLDQTYALQSAPAASLLQGLAAEPPLQRVHVRSAPLAVLEGVECPALLLETGFLSNPTEENALKNQDFRAALARTLAEGLTRALG